jgi:hypothetical protein
MSLADNPWGLHWSAITCTLAAILTLWGAKRGVVQHRIPRVILGVAAAVIAASYWIQLIHDHENGALFEANMRRGAAFILWPALAWVAWSGVAYSREVVAATQQLLESSDEL